MPVQNYQLSVEDSQFADVIWYIYRSVIRPTNG